MQLPLFFDAEYVLLYPHKNSGNIVSFPKKETAITGGHFVG